MNKEEAIKRIRLLIQDECTCEVCKKNKEAYKFVLNYIEDLEEKNSKLLDEQTETYMNDKYLQESVNRLVNKNFIPKQVVLDKIEELKNKEKEYEEKSQGIQINDYYHRKFLEVCHKKQILQEILGKGEKYGF